MILFCVGTYNNSNNALKPELKMKTIYLTNHLLGAEN